MEARGAIYGVSPRAPPDPLSAVYRERKARLHNQTKNVKITLSAVVRSFRA